MARAEVEYALEHLGAVQHRSTATQSAVNASDKLPLNE
jgi:hypothetical protein